MYLFTMVDFFSKYDWAKLAKDKTTYENIIEFYYLFQRFHNQTMETKLWMKLLKIYAKLIKFIHGRPYHP